MEAGHADADAVGTGDLFRVQAVHQIGTNQPACCNTERVFCIGIPLAIHFHRVDFVAGVHGLSQGAGEEWNNVSDHAVRA